MGDTQLDVGSLFLGQDERCRSAYAEAVCAAAAHVQGMWQELDGATSGRSYAEIERQLAAIEVCPQAGVGLSAALREVRELILPAIVAVGHPEYAAHLHSVPAIPALAAEVIISATNQSLDSFDQAPSATAVERAVIAWLSAAFGLGTGGDGLFTSGATKSNLMGLMLARDEHARTRLDHDVHKRGVPPQAAHWRILCSQLAHFSVERSAAQPAALKRFTWSTESAIDSGPSMEMPLSSNSTISLLRRQWPAIAIASCETPSIRSPSDAST